MQPTARRWRPPFREYASSPMAIYHLSVKPVSRASGRSATAAAAYRAAGRIEDASTGTTFDYSRKRGVEHAEIVLPTSAARADIQWPRDRAALWNAAEQAEARKDARVAREYEVALPHELTRAQRLELVREFSQALADRHGVAVDFAIHAPHREGDARNHHAHILTTTRQLEAAGLGAKADIELKDTDRAKKGLEPSRKEIAAIREQWASLSNAALERHGHSARVDHRSLEAQGITDRAPTTHLGPAVQGLARRGKDSIVLERIAGQQREDAQRRIEAAAELGRLDRESRDLQRSILVLDGDIRSALATRDLLMHTTNAPTPEHLRQQAREQWIAMQRGQGTGATATSGISKGLENGKGASTTPSTDTVKDGGRETPDGGMGM